MLGGEQKAWLKDELRASRAPFKVLVSGGGFSKAERGGDSWAVYTNERDELFDFIRDNRGCLRDFGRQPHGRAQLRV
jgi:alkaline phosphatase D